MQDGTLTEREGVRLLETFGLPLTPKTAPKVYKGEVTKKDERFTW